MTDFLDALAGDLAATNDGWLYDAPSRTWTHPTGVKVKHQFGRRVLVTGPGGSEDVLCSERGVESDGALDVAARLVEIARQARTRGAS